MLQRPDITGVILAAGKSGRMHSFKPLLLYRGKTFLEQITVKLFTICTEVVVISGAFAEQLPPAGELAARCGIPETGRAGLRIVHNPQHETGMMSSIRTAAGTVTTDWMIAHFADQPHIPENFYGAFADEIIQPYNWVQPLFGGRGGHPVALHRSLLKIIDTNTGLTSLRDLSAATDVQRKLWGCPYPEVRQDFDTPEEYATLPQV